MYGRLRRVVVRAPAADFGEADPRLWHYTGRTNLSKAQREHDDFCELLRDWGAEVIRGSANESGALALRDMQGMMKRGYSIVTTADGPRGPIYEIKPGVVVMARIGGIPVLPVSCAASRVWELNRWDNFMVPLPFSRVVLAIGEPYTIPPDVPLNEIEPHRLNVQEAVMSLMRQSEARLQSD